MSRAHHPAPAPFTRAQQRRRELILATIRSETGNSELKLRGEHFYNGAVYVPISAAHLQAHDLYHDAQAQRGRADAISARLLFSNADVHRSSMPADPVAGMLFDLLEQFRTEALLRSNHQPGTQQNIRYRFDAWSRLALHANLVESKLGILIFTVIQIVRSRLFSTPIDPKIEDLIEATRAGITPCLGSELAGLRRNKDHQTFYGRHALSLAEKVSNMVSECENNEDDNERSEQILSAFPLLLSTDIEADNTYSSVTGGNSKSFEMHRLQYRVFNREFDTEIDASSLVRKAQIAEFRSHLDKRFLHLGLNLREISKRLLLCLNQKTRDGWQFEEEEGYIDGSRLPQVVSSPMERRVFIKEHFVERPDSAVTILIDCSGSMRQHMESIIHLVDGLVRALGIGGVPTEVLGYTTCAWNGGRPYKKWLMTGRHAMPGRMNEVCHLIFKDAGTHWRQGSKNLAALMKGDIFREGIDGEAIEWACARSRQIDTSRHLLLVISDGSPIDTATNLTNDDFYLDNHLKQVIASREKQGDIITALGVGVDLSRFYPLNLTLDIDFQPDSATFNDVITLIAESVRRSYGKRRS
ncbi:aerobic cobaltochelatase CobT subunit [Grimontia sp. AD028]|uniref:cobaltochelatase CobT-related protein n=1 Tax=Grimontia sp. AD028 TaxID=1581149 RepID=UPI00061AF2E6|nr:aerobic cobaltochelatase CobT subunit [Grimontia sp. AD028]KKD61816.1 aerobic cobaltochelatase CobT subunit [Grimontia sp. AD028]